MNKSCQKLVPGALAVLSLVQPAAAAESVVPEVFQRFDPNSTYVIKYADLDALYANAVINMGRSTREKAAPTQAATGTRMKEKFNRSSAREANRFGFESFEDSEENRLLLSGIRDSLAAIPGEVSLEHFSRDEQLAYWINLYNITILNELVAIYPRRSLKKYLTGKDSILQQKLLVVAGIPLSLDDIQFSILGQNYNHNPMIMYGLYQGIIGGPNIRQRAYTGENVHRYLLDNAREFVNSNRGTYSQNASTFRASSLYERDKVYFPNFQADLKQHLLGLLEGQEKSELQLAVSIKTNIDDWTITDLYGSYQKVGGSFATNSAALIDSVTNTTRVNGVLVTTVNAQYSTGFAAESELYNRFDPEFLEYLNQVKLKQEEATSKSGTVTVEELGQVSDEPEESKEE